MNLAIGLHNFCEIEQDVPKLHNNFYMGSILPQIKESVEDCAQEIKSAVEIFKGPGMASLFYDYVIRFNAGLKLNFGPSTS